MSATVNRDQLTRVVEELLAGEQLTLDHLIRIFGGLPVIAVINDELQRRLSNRQREDLYRAAAISGALAMQAGRRSDLINVDAITTSAEAVVTSLRQKGILS